jgi:hypothetical protein
VLVVIEDVDRYRESQLDAVQRGTEKNRMNSDRENVIGVDTML